MLASPTLVTSFKSSFDFHFSANSTLSSLTSRLKVVQVLKSKYQDVSPSGFLPESSGENCLPGSFVGQIQFLIAELEFQSPTGCLSGNPSRFWMLPASVFQWLLLFSSQKWHGKSLWCFNSPCIHLSLVRKLCFIFFFTDKIKLFKGK